MLGKTSTKKYEAMLTTACADHRVRGLLQYYGAGRTGRWAGRLLQVQNLPQNHLDNIALVRELVRDRDLETLERLFDSVPDVLSQLIRTALIAKPGHTFIVCDYSAIEARVIAYLAGEKWRMDVFAQGGDIYCSSASQMFKVPVEKHGVNGHLRAKGKVAGTGLYRGRSRSINRQRTRPNRKSYNRYESVGWHRMGKPRRRGIPRRKGSYNLWGTGGDPGPHRMGRGQRATKASTI